MDINAAQPTPGARSPDATARARNEALAEARARTRADSVEQARDQRVRSAEALAATREAIARAIGFNTRLSISRAEGALDFVYRAIDIDSGEIVQEWPEEAFLTLIKGIRGDVTTDPERGLILDETA